MEFEIAATALGDGLFNLSTAGEVDLATAPKLQDALTDVIEAGARGVVVDLSDATFIDSTVLGVLVGVGKRLRPSGGALAIVSQDPNVRRIFEITLLDRVFKIFESSGAAVAHLEGLNPDLTMPPAPD
jgi:anti-sigma B factor antagonist